MRPLAFFCVLVSLTMSGCDYFVDPDHQANRIFVEANNVWSEYQKITKNDPVQYEDRLKLLKSVANSLDRIVAEYPESDLAVKLVAEGQVADIARRELSANYLDLSKKIECKNNLRGCLLGNIHAALQDNKEEHSWFFRDSVLVDLVLAQIEKKDYKEAVNTANLIEEASIKYVALAEVGLRQSSKNAVEQAIDKIKAIDDSFLRNSALESIALKQAAAGFVKDAKATLALIRDGSYRDNAIRAIAIRRAESGDFSGARKIVEGITNEATRTSAHIEIDYIETPKERVSDILDRVLKINESELRNFALGTLALLMWKSDFISALEVAEKIDDIDHRLKIIKEMTKLNNIRQEAKKSQKSLRVKGGYEVAYELVEIAKERISSGDLPAATETAKRAFDAAIALQDPDARTWMLGKVSAVKKELGDTLGAKESARQAFKTALAIENPTSRVVNLVEAAKYQASVGDHEGATRSTLYVLESLDGNEDASSRAQWLVDLYKITP